MEENSSQMNHRDGYQASTSGGKFILGWFWVLKWPYLILDGFT